MKAIVDVATQAQDGGRRAALAMHALREHDRAWILRQLPPGQREQLEGLLAELKSLSIPASPALVQEMLAAAPAAVSKPATAARPQAEGAVQLDAVARLEAAQVLRLIHGEPAGLIAQLLDIRHWPWQDAVLEQLGVVKRRRVEEVLDLLRRKLRARTPQALNRALVEGLLTRARAEQPKAPSPDSLEVRGAAPRAWPRRWGDALVRRIGVRA